MVVMKIEKESDRHFFEIHQQGENGKWYRMVSSDLIEGDNEKDMFKQVLESARERIGWTRGLVGFLPSELLHTGKLRLVRVHRHNKIFEFDVKKALRATRVSSKA